MDRRLLAVGALCLLMAAAGCSALTPGGGEVDRERLEEDANYDWNTSTDVAINVTPGYYHAVYQVENRSTLGLSRFHRLNDHRPLDIGAVAFRYPNGTVVGPEAMAFERNRTHTRVTLPAEEGRFAYRVARQGKRIRIATAATGSYEVVLPPDTDVRYFLIGRVVPDGYDRHMEDGRVHLVWDGADEVTGDRVVVRFYLYRDLWIFGGLIAIGTGAALVGLAYFWLQLKELRQRRDTVDVERDGS